MFISPLGCSCTTSPSQPQLKSEPTSAESFHEVPSLQLKYRDFLSTASNLASASVTVTPSYDACKRATVCRSRGDPEKNRRGKGGELTLHQTRQTKRSFFQRQHFSSVFYRYESCGRRKCSRSGAAGKPRLPFSFFKTSSCIV